jgi:hypothetical protein
VSGRFRFARFESAKNAVALDIVTAVSVGTYNSAIMRSWCDDSGCWDALGLWAHVGFDYEYLVDHFRLAAGFGAAAVAARLETTIFPGVEGVVQKPGNPIVPDIHVAVGIAF